MQQDQLFIFKQLRRLLMFERNEDEVQQLSFSNFRHHHRYHCSAPRGSGGKRIN